MASIHFSKNKGPKVVEMSKVILLYSTFISFKFGDDCRYFNKILQLLYIKLYFINFIKLILE